MRAMIAGAQLTRFQRWGVRSEVGWESKVVGRGGDSDSEAASCEDPEPIILRALRAVTAPTE